MASFLPPFSPLDATHREALAVFTKDFPPYSDFNFTSIFSWNTTNEILHTVHRGNLIIRFTDYITGEKFYSFLGNHDVNETAAELLEKMSDEGLGHELKLIPEHVAVLLSPEQFTVTPDEDNFDYILPVEKLVTYAGKELGPKRNFVNRFKKMYSSQTSLLNLQDSQTQNMVMKSFDKWVQDKGLDLEAAKNEYAAITRSFLLAGLHELLVVGVFVDAQLAGFTVNEVLPEAYAILHFEKADAATYIGIYQYLMQETAKILSGKGSRWLNYEQDLGIPGLKTAKTRFYPCAHLKKYRVSKKTTV